MASSSSSCLPTPTVASTFTISSPSQLSLPSAYPTTRIKRNGTRLYDEDGTEFKAVGANIYWLGLDENVSPSPSWPTKGRVQEVLAVASAMGANTIRSTTLGVSVGTSFSVLGNTSLSSSFANQDALAVIDWAVWSAGSYGMRLVIPLVDQYDYYHGGIPTFLRSRNLSPTNYSAFYDLQGDVYKDFSSYIDLLLTHRSNITGLSLANDSTVLAFESGNELGGWGLRSYPPPVEWTRSVAKLIKQLSPNSLFVSGSYGVRKEEGEIAEVDMLSNHYYPPYSSNLVRSASLAASFNKAFLVGEFDWTNRYYFPLLYLIVIAPALPAMLIWLLPAKWWPWRAQIRTCCCCFFRSRRRWKGRPVPTADRGPNTSSTPIPAESSHFPLSHLPAIASSSRPSFHESHSSKALLHRRVDTAPSSSVAHDLPTSSLTNFSDCTFSIRRWHISLFFLLICPLLGGLVHLYLPTPLTSFLSAIESQASQGHLSGSVYWSLFGRVNSCCNYVQHNDGYTLHYPSSPGGENGGGVGAKTEGKVVELTKHAWRIKGTSPSWVSGLNSVDNFDVGDLAVVHCPQEQLAPVRNVTS
ncbi:glycoside hydrolase [Meredithblackwellia eburnea MCA 4105]